MADEKEVTIVIRGKNLTQAEFSAARKELAGVDDQAKKTGLSAANLGTAFKALGAAFSIGAIGSAIKSYADFTGQLTDMSAKTGIGVEALQRLKYAAEQNGGTLEQVTGAISKLGANLAGGKDSAVGALDALGLKFADIRGMAPDQAFTKIGDAIAKIPDPMAQSKLAMDLFGKSGAELLPMMKGNLSETAAAADRLGIVLSEKAVKAGDEFGDTMTTLGAVGKSVIAQVLEPMIPVLTTIAQWLGEKLPGAVKFIVDALSVGLGRAFLDAKIWMNEFILGVAEGVNKIPLLGDKIGFSSQTIAGLRANVDNAKDALAIFTEGTIASAASHEKAGKTVATLNLDYAENERAAKRSAAANDVLDPTVQRLTESFKKQIEAHEKARTSVSGPAIPDGFRLQRVELEKLEPLQTKNLQSVAAAQDAARKWALENGATLAPSIKAVGSALSEATGQTAKFGASIADSFRNIGTTILSAVQGGGSVTQAVGSSLGMSLGKDMATQLGESFPKFFNTAIGGALSAVLPGLGALVGPLMGKLVGLFTNKNTAEVKAYNVEISKVRDSLLDTYGPLDQLEAKAQAVGLSFKDAWGHQGKAGLEAMKTLAQEFKDKWDGLNQSLATSQAELDALRKRGSDLGYEFDANGNLVKVSFEKMSEAAKKYGVDLGSLGGAFQNQRLHQTAEEIINDFTLLTKGGADVGGVLVGMKDEISALVRDSIKFGTAIPANMQPWVQELLRTGQLTDENGDKMTDLSALQFGDPIKTQWEQITSSLKDVVASLQSIASTIAQIPTNKTLTISTDYVDHGPPAGWGEGDGEGPGFARGTFGTLGRDFPDWGDGTRVVVHNREAIVPEEDKMSTARRWLGMGDGAPAAAGGPINLYLAIDAATGAVRRLGEDARAQVQGWIYAGEIDMPARFVSGGRR